MAVRQSSNFCSGVRLHKSYSHPIKPLSGYAPLAGALMWLSFAVEPTSYATEQDAAGSGLQEIIVTANKRAEPLQKTPEAITVVTHESLIFSGVTDIRGAEEFVPSARFQQENLSTEIYIRGVGSTLDFPQVTSPNVFNFNGISVPREATGAPLYDVEQIEVLPGPQGTLYGSSAMGGAVNVNFRRPTFD